MNRLSPLTSLRRSPGLEVALIAGSQLSNQGATLLLLILAARALDPPAYGLFALALGTAMAVSLIPGVGIDWAAVRISSSQAVESIQRSHETLRVGAEVKIACAVVACTIVLAFSQPVAVMLDRPGVGTAMRVGALAAFALAITNYCLSTLQARALYQRFISMNLGAATLKMLAFLLLPTLFGLTLTGAYSLYVIILYAVGLVAVGLSLMDLAVPASRRPAFNELLAYARWLTPAAVLGTLFSALDLYSVTFLTNAEVLGQYAAARTPTLAVAAVAVVVAAALLPRASRITDRRTLLRFTVFAVLGLLPVVASVLLAALVAPFVFVHLFGSEYAGAVSAFQLLAIAFSIDVLAGPVMVFVLVSNRPDLLTWSNAIVLVITVLAFALVLQGRGASAAAAITLFSRALLALLTLASAIYAHRRVESLGAGRWPVGMRPEGVGR